MHIFENEITLGNRPILDEYMNSYEYKTSGLSFSSMYMWRNINLFQWDIIGDYMCVTGLSHLEPVSYTHLSRFMIDSFRSKHFRKSRYYSKREDCWQETDFSNAGNINGS